MKQLEVQIMGQSYLLTAPEGGEQSLIAAVEKVDTAMCRIRDAGKVKARDRIAVLAALNLAFETKADTAPPPALAASAWTHSSADETSLAMRLGALADKLDQAMLTRDGQLL